MEAYLDPELMKRFFKLISKRLSLASRQDAVDLRLGDLFEIFEIEDHFEFQVQDLARIIKKIHLAPKIGVKFIGYRLGFDFDHEGKLFNCKPDQIGRLEPDVSYLVFALNETFLAQSKMRDDVAKEKKSISKKPVRQDTSRVRPELLHNYVTKSEDTFYFNGTPIYISLGTLYREVFEIIFACHGPDGSISYEKIEQELRNREFPPRIGATSRSRIRNALSTTQGLFNYARFNGSPLSNALPNGKMLIETVRGRGVRFNNVKS